MTTISPIDLQKALKGADYPADRDELVSLAKDNGAGEQLVAALSRAPMDRFDGPNDVQKAVFDELH